MHHFNGRMLFPLPVENAVEIVVERQLQSRNNLGSGRLEFSKNRCTVVLRGL
jgi:hypothetical protein